MSSTHEPSSSDPSPEEIRLAELLERYEETREKNPTAGIGLLREEAGEVFPELVDVAESLKVLRSRLGEDEEEEVPVEIGGFTVLEKIATGGLGVVYRAENPETHEVVAIKVIRESLALSGDAMTRFRREIRAVQGLDHPHIVKTLGHGECEGRIFLALEFVDGVSLAGLIERLRAECGEKPGEDWLTVLDECGVPALAKPGRTPAETYARRLAAIFAPVADALRAAAEAGLVHRDIKPANLLLRRDGKLLVTDFGAAKITGDDITSTIAVLGTPLFMSPEQASGRSREVDARTDVYGLGATFYSLLTLDHPVKGTTFSETLAAIVHKKPRSISAFCSAYPSGIAHVIARCLEKEPRDRYPTPSDLRLDLARVAGRQAPKMSHPPMLRRISRFLVLHRAAAIAFAFVLVVATGTMLWLTGRDVDLTIRTFPVGEIALNGEMLPTSPWNGKVPSGEVVIRVVRDRFEPLVRRESFTSGDTVRLDLPLRPSDPCDRVALRAIFEAHGLEVQLPSGDVTTTMRGDIPIDELPWEEAVLLLAPRGAMTRDGAVIRLWAARPEVGIRVEILAPKGGEILHSASVDLLTGHHEIPLPKAVVAGFRDGVAYRVQVEKEGSRRNMRERFDIVAMPDALAAIDAVYGAEDSPHVQALRAGAMIQAGLFGQAYAAAARMAEEEPGRKLPHRLAVSALEGLGAQANPLEEFHAKGYRSGTD